MQECMESKKMFQEFEPGQVQMLDPYCVNAFEKEKEYLKKIDIERLLAGFYENAGIASPKIRYKGWEDSLIGGHTLGHFLTAVSQAYVNEAGKEDKDLFLYKVTDIVDALSKCQKNTKGKPGFVFGATLTDPENVELQFDMVEHNRTDIFKEAWVPWYTMHKILDGLINAYRLTGYDEALRVAANLGDWVYERTSKWSEKTHKTVLSIEYGGMNDVLYDLYSYTGREEHLIAAHLFDEEDLFKKVASGVKNALSDLHANTTIPKFLGALNRYLTTGDKAYLDYAVEFWDMVVTHHTYATGGNSEWEHFGKDDVLDAKRTNCNNETCNTYNMLKMTRKLFMITGDKKYADYYENTFVNAILSSQNPLTGMTMYFQPMASGYFKVYSTEFTKFWCCTGSGMENFTKLGDSIYFKDENSITVNMFFSSEAYHPELGIKLIQESDIPQKDTVRFTVRLLNGASRHAKIRIRIPDWAYDHSILSENKRVTTKDGYLCLDGEWTDKESFSYVLRSRVIAKSLPDCSNVFAFSYGPVLLSADLGCENMTDSSTGVDVTIPADKIAGKEVLKVTDTNVTGFIREIDSHMKRNGESLSFDLKGVDRDLTFSPHYKKTRERYGIYWYFE